MKELKFNLGGQTLSVGLDAKIDKKARYGRARKVVEKDGKQLASRKTSPKVS